ncbi:MAG: glycosyltransferase family 25 protein [Candidatus Fonsibacter ubiquis]
MKTLNNYFDKIVCINLDRRFDRWEKSQKQFKNFNLNVERFSAIDGKVQVQKPGLKPGELGALLSHLKVIKNAKKDNLKNVLILEDDVEFHQNINELFFQYESQIPNWDFLYFGGNHSMNNHYMDPSKSPIKIFDNVYKIREAYSLHCYGVNHTLYDKILNFYDKIERPIDVLYSEIQPKVQSYILIPPLAWQRPDYSDIMEENVDYSFLKK